MDLIFLLKSLLLGAGLAMDAFSLSIANGLADPQMRHAKGFAIALTFGFFQWLMPLLGWVCVHFFLERFQAFQPAIPWIAFFLLLYFGGGMIRDSRKPVEEKKEIGYSLLCLQGLATSIDALSTGFIIADQPFVHAFVCSLIIGLVTFFLCTIGVFLGKKLGIRLAEKARFVGGVILILIGVNILYSAHPLF